MSHLIDGNDVRAFDRGAAEYKILPFDENTKREAVGEIMVDLISEGKMAPATYIPRTDAWRIQVDEIMEWIIPDCFMSKYASHWVKKTHGDDVPYRVEVYEYANSSPYGIAEWDESEKIWIVEEYGILQFRTQYTTDEMLEKFDIWKVQ